MLSIAIRKQISSKSIQLNELKPFIGKNVIITITEDLDETSKLEKFSDFFDAVGKISIDDESINSLRVRSLI